MPRWTSIGIDIARKVIGYIPNAPPAKLDEAFRTWAHEEFKAVARAQRETFAIASTAPAKPWIGMTVFADGSNWDPGAGAGPYVYLSTGWRAMFRP